MPAFVGPIKLNNMGSSAIFKVGDSFSLSPKAKSKASIGSGGANTGDFIETQNLFNITNFQDIDMIDQQENLNF